MAELYQLQEQEIPKALGELQDNHVNLKKVADYCEGLYLQASDAEKRQSLEETRDYTTQALASVAYQINTLATSFLSLLDLQANQLVEMESSVNHLSQTVSIHKEKVARREIGVLTTNKNFYRPAGVKTPGIIFPDAQEKPVKYIRKPIDYSILDGVGCGGVKAQTVTRDRLASQRSVSSSATSNSNSQAPVSLPAGQPSLAGTLTRGGHYRQGNLRAGPIAPPVAPPTVPSHYATAQQLQQAQNMGSPLNVANAGYAQGHMQGIPPPPPSMSMGAPPPAPPFPMDPPPPTQYGGVMNGEVSPPAPLSPPLPPMPTMDDFNMHQDMPPPPPPDAESEDEATDHGHIPMGVPPPPMDMNGPAQDPHWAPEQYMEKVIASFDYEPQNDDELRFRENTMIYVIKKNSDGWWEGVMEIDGQPICGLFPANYVEPL